MNKITYYTIGKIIDDFRFILEDKGYKELVSKNEKLLKFRKLTIVDDTFTKIDVTFWENFAMKEIEYSIGYIIFVKNVSYNYF